MDYKIEDLPKSERPREKLEKQGSSNMTDVELLSIILRTGTKGKNVKELSSEILNELSLEELASRELSELKEFKGVSKVKAGQLKALGELSRRMKKEEKEQISSLQDVKAMCGDMKFLEQEELRIFYLSSGNDVLDKVVKQGGVSAVEADFREIFRKGMNSNAAAMILVHNHPSGEANPTDADLEFTSDAIVLGRKLGVEVLDHIVVGDSFFSMRESSSLKF